MMMPSVGVGAALKDGSNSSNRLLRLAFWMFLHCTLIFRVLQSFEKNDYILIEDRSDIFLLHKLIDCVQVASSQAQGLGIHLALCK